MSPLSSQPSHSLLLAPASQAGSQRSSWEHSTICHTAARCPRKSGSGGIYLSGPPSSQRVPAALAVLGPHSILQVPTVPRANIRHVGERTQAPGWHHYSGLWLGNRCPSSGVPLRGPGLSVGISADVESWLSPFFSRPSWKRALYL